MVTVPGPGPASAITAVRGPIPPGDVGVVLAAESLLRAPALARGNAGIPASDAEFRRAPVTIDVLGRLLMGAENTEDRTIGESEAAAALLRFRSAAAPAAPGVPAGMEPRSPDGDGIRLLVSLDERDSTGTGDALARVSAASGVEIVRGTAGRSSEGRAEGRADGGRTAPDDPESVGLRILAELSAPAHSAGVVGAIPVRDAHADGGADRVGRADSTAGTSHRAADRRSALIRAAADAARRSGAALVLDLSDPGAPGAPASTNPQPDATPALDRALHRALAAVDSAGLPRHRVLLTGVATAVAGRIGIDGARFDALLDQGTALCFDDLGRIPNVRTVVSDHDIALAILHAAEQGALERILLSCGIRNRHRLTAFGGNGLEFTVEQFLPYLGMLGADPALQHAVGGANAARILARTAPEETR